MCMYVYIALTVREYRRSDWCCFVGLKYLVIMGNLENLWAFKIFNESVIFQIKVTIKEQFTFLNLSL